MAGLPGLRSLYATNAASPPLFHRPAGELDPDRSAESNEAAPKAASHPNIAGERRPPD